MNSLFDIAIIGAGPAGTTCALTLQNSSLKVALLDKSEFPRDKICGDAIPGPSFKTFRELLPKFYQELLDFQKTKFIKSSKVFTPNGKHFSVSWVLKTYNCPRYHFDNQLMGMVEKHTATNIFTGEKVTSLSRANNLFSIETNQQTIQAKLVIGADGANGITAKTLTNFALNRQHHCAAVRAYYQNVEVEKGVNEFYILNDYLNGYFWIFPLADGGVNVGFGMLSQEISHQNINLRESLHHIIATNPLLQKKFANATQEGKVIGFGLPLGSRRATLAGDGFMLTGDAGSLIDPLQGHGIDKAIWSGYQAAQHAMDAFAQNRFDSAFLQQYEKAIYKKYRWEFFRNYWLMRGWNKGARFLNFLVGFVK